MFFNKFVYESYECAIIQHIFDRILFGDTYLHTTHIYTLQIIEQGN